MFLYGFKLELNWSFISNSIPMWKLMNVFWTNNFVVFINDFELELDLNFINNSDGVSWTVSGNNTVSIIYLRKPFIETSKKDSTKSNWIVKLNSNGRWAKWERTTSILIVPLNCVCQILLSLMHSFYIYSTVLLYI